MRFRTYRRDPRVTNDRVPPKWFLDGLKKIDPHLKVEWWNSHPIKGPSYRLVRVLPDGRFAAIEWFQYEDQMRTLLKWLVRNDTHRHGYSVSQAERDIYAQQMHRVETERKETAEKMEAHAHEVGEEAIRYAMDSRYRNNKVEKMYSIPGVKSRKDWNAA